MPPMAIKTGRKKVEYRDAIDHWTVRLLSESGRKLMKDVRSGNLMFCGSLMKHDKAVFVVGRTKYPRLLADISYIVYRADSEKFAVHIENVIELLREAEE